MWKPIAVPKPLTAGVALRPPLYYMVGVEQGASSAVALAPAEIRSRRMPDYQVKNVEPVAVGADVQVRVFTLTDGEEIPWHYHSESTDHYFVLRGKLTIETRSAHHDAGPKPKPRPRKPPAPAGAWPPRSMTARAFRICFAVLRDTLHCARCGIRLRDCGHSAWLATPGGYYS
jgi:hypothetical protein